MKKADNTTIINNLIPTGTTHLMMWFGGELPEKRIIEYRKEQPKYPAGRDDENGKCYVNYAETLKKECKKMEDKGEACILVYDSNMIDEAGKQKMKNIVKDIPNCYLVDFEEYSMMLEKNLQSKDNNRIIETYDYYGENVTDKSNNVQSWMIEHINKLVKCNVKKPTFLTKNIITGMGNLVDCARMLLLLHPSKLKQLAIESNKGAKKTIPLNTEDYCMLYHDFDMIYTDKKTKYVDIENEQHYEVVQPVKDKPLLLCEAMGGACKNIGYENGIIRAVSTNDDNDAILSIMTSYKKTTKACESKSSKEYRNLSSVNMFMATCYDKKCMSADFRELFTDEGHRSWQIDPKTAHAQQSASIKQQQNYADKKINNNSSEYYEKNNTSNDVGKKEQ